MLDLKQLNPGGALSAADQSTYDTLRATKIPFSLGPTGVAAATNALIATAGAIAQNQQAVLIDGGAGSDTLVPAAYPSESLSSDAASVYFDVDGLLMQIGIFRGCAGRPVRLASRE